MKTTKLATLLTGIALLLFVALPNLSWAAEDGAALYKAKCSACHGADADGKPSRHTPGIKGNTKGRISYANKTSPQHVSVKKLSDQQVQAIADYLCSLK